jgi:hypothetical protein
MPFALPFFDQIVSPVSYGAAIRAWAAPRCSNPPPRLDAMLARVGAFDANWQRACQLAPGVSQSARRCGYLRRQKCLIASRTCQY